MERLKHETDRKKKKKLPKSTTEVLTHQPTDKQKRCKRKEKEKEKETVWLVFNSRQPTLRAFPVR